MYRVFLLLLLLSSVIAVAQVDKPSLQHFTTDNGLPTNNVYSVVQDKDGYLWFATEKGVLKYNGYDFKVFNVSNGLPANDVWKLTPDSRGRVWVHCHSQKFGYIKDDVFKTVKIPTENNSGLITVITEIDGLMYFGYLNNFNMIFAVIDTADNVSIVDKFKTYVGLGVDKNNMYVIKKKGELFKYSGIGKRSINKHICNFDKVEFPPQVRIFNDKLISYFSGKNDLVIADLNNCFCDKTTLKKYGGNPDEFIYLVAENTNSQRIIYSNKALYKLDSALNLETRTEFVDLIGSQDQVAFFFTDKFKNEWYTTNANGIWFSGRERNIFKPLPHLKKLIGFKFLGQHNGYTFWWDKKLKSVFKVDEQFRVSLMSSHKETVHKIVYLPLDRKLYYLTSLGAFTYEKGNAVPAFTEMYYSILSGDTSIVPAYIKDNYNVIWFNIFQTAKDNYIFSTPNGISKLVAKKDSMIAYNYDNNRHPNILFDSSSNLYWFHDLEEIDVLNANTDKLVGFGDVLLKYLGIQSYSSIQVDKHHNVYVLANNKLLVYNYAKQKLLTLPSNFGLANSFLRIHGDKLFLIGSFGIAYADIQGALRVGNFKIVPNPGNYFNVINDIVIDDLNRMILQTDKGIYLVQLSELYKNNALFNNDDKNFICLVAKKPQRRIQSSDTVTISSEAQTLELDAINFYGKGTPKYTYSIDGFSNWQVSNSGEIFLPNLKPDKVYKVNCVVSDDNWKSSVFTFYLYKTPYWWQTSTWRTIFWIVGIVSFLIIILGAVLVTRYFVEKNNQKKQQLLDLELRAIHSQINPHFIFNTLGTALYFISKKNFDDAYYHVNKFSRLLRSYLKSSHDRYISLSEEIEMLKNYIELQQIRFEQKINHSIEIDNKVAANSIQIPSLLLQPLVENAINHGLFHLPQGEKGLLLLKFIQGSTSNELICIIEDNGVGRKKAREIKQNSEARQESYGTTLTESLIDVFQKYENMNIFLEYVDKEGPDTGTIVKLIIRNIKYVV